MCCGTSNPALSDWCDQRSGLPVTVESELISSGISTGAKLIAARCAIVYHHSAF